MMFCFVKYTRSTPFLLAVSESNHYLFAVLVENLRNFVSALFLFLMLYLRRVKTEQLLMGKWGGGEASNRSPFSKVSW